MKAFRKTKVDRALRRSMLTNGGEAALILASRVERTIHLRGATRTHEDSSPRFKSAVKAAHDLGR